jgi:hypothetical protein
VNARESQFFKDLKATAAYTRLVEAIELAEQSGADYTPAEFDTLARGILHYQSQAPSSSVVDIESWEDSLQRLTDPNRTSVLVSTGIKELDEFLDGGMQPGTVVALVGGEGTGKSTLQKNIAYAALRRGVPTGFIALEGGVEGFRVPLITMASGLLFSAVKHWWNASSRPSQQRRPWRRRSSRSRRGPSSSACRRTPSIRSSGSATSIRP